MKNAWWLVFALVACGGSPAKPVEVPAMPRCEFLVTSEPAGADVAVNGVPAGKTPFKTSTGYDPRFQAGCDPVKFDLTRPGYKSRAMTVRQPGAGEQMQIVIRLEPEPGTTSLE